jgi:Tubulin like
MPTLRPMLFVGCGGSGGKTLRITHDAILRRLRNAGWQGPMPEAWQFLWVDVPNEQEGDESFGERLDPSSYLGLVKPGTQYRTGIDPAISSLRNVDPMELVGWRPNPAQVTIPIEQGAGQFRAVGRMISLKEGAGITSRIQSAFQATAVGTALAELDQVCKRLGALSDPDPRAFIVSSLAGGSGSGTFLDIADILRAVIGKEGTVGILYTADVFSDLNGIEGVEGNSLAALSELLSGYWQEDERHLSLLQAQGLPAGSVTRGGVTYPFLVGKKNTNGVALDSQVEVYRAIGELLALITVSPDVQESLLNFCQAQWSSAALANADKLEIQEPDAMAPVSSFGYSRIGLGRDRFKEYAMRRLARTAIDFLSTGYLSEALLGHSSMTPQEVVRSIVETSQVQFLRDCELHERNFPELKESNDQITDALRPEAMASLWSGIDKDVLQKQASATDTDLNNWLKRFQETSALMAKDFENDFERALHGATLQWTEKAPEKLIYVTCDYVTRFGLSVTLELLLATSKELESVATQLLNEAGQLEQEGGNWMGKIGQLGLPFTGNLQASHPKMAQVVNAVNKPLRVQSASKVARRASSLMVEFSKQVVTPLADALRTAQDTFLADSGPTSNGEPASFLSWPTGQIIPDSLKPSKVEFLLDDLEKYPEIFERLVTETVGSATEASGGSDDMTTARQQVIGGGFPVAGGNLSDRSIRRSQPGLGAPRRWSPVIAGGQGQPLRFVAEFGEADIVSRSEMWIQQEGVFRSFLRESLADYLNEGKASAVIAQGLEQRLSSFESKLAAALASSSPLINVNTNLYARTHGGTPDTSWVIEPLPFATGHPARACAEQILTKAMQQRSSGGSTGDVASLFASENAAGIGSVGIVSYFASPVHPVVFSSVTKPISSRLQQSSNSFWLWRRSRLLSEYIPISSSARRAMLRGWFTGRLLGLIPFNDPRAHGPFSLTAPGGETFEFPHPPLGGFVGANDLPVAAVLESIPIALLEWAADNPTPISAYRTLFRLGLSDPDLLIAADGRGYFAGDKLRLYGYDVMNPTLASWITHGVIDGVSIEVPLDGSDPATREQSVRDQCGKMSDSLKELQGSSKVTLTNLLQAPRGIDLLSESLAEIETIKNAKCTVTSFRGQF